MKHIVNIITNKWVVLVIFVFLVLVVKQYDGGMRHRSKSKFQEYPEKIRSKNWLKNRHVQIMTIIFAVYLIVSFRTFVKHLSCCS